MTSKLSILSNHAQYFRELAPYYMLLPFTIYISCFFGKLLFFLIDLVNLFIFDVFFNEFICICYFF